MKINTNKLFYLKNFILLFFIMLLLVIITLVKNPFYQDLIIMTFFYVTVASAWNIIGGFAGQISLGHAVYFGIGAYSSTLLYLHFGLSPWFGMLFGAILAILIGIGIGFPCFKLKGHFFVLATIASAEVVRLLAFYWKGLTNGGVGLLIPFKPGLEYLMFEGKAPYMYIFFILVLISILVSLNIKRSRFGYYLFSIKEDQDVAESLGINTLQYKLKAMIVSVFLTALAGTFFVQYMHYFNPDTVFSFDFSIKIATFCIIGGVGTIIGPVIGSFILVPLEVLSRGWLGPIFAGLNNIIYGIVVIMAAIYFPRGIAGWLEKWHSFIIKKFPSREIPLKEKEISFPIENFSNFYNNFNSLKDESVILEVKGLTKHFGGLTAVKNVDFQIKRGEILGLIGPNGAGKTTIFGLLSGFISPDFGEIKLNGENISGLKSPHKICKKGMVRTFQLVKPLKRMTVLENVMVATFCRMSNVREAKKKAKEILCFFGLSKFQDVLAINLTIADRKKLELCRALATGSELLLLDEVMAGLNPKETEEIIDIVKKISQMGVTLIVVEHVMKVIMRLSNRIIVLDQGEKIAEGKPIEISKDKNVIKAYLGEKYVTEIK